MAKLTKMCPGCDRWIHVENFRGEMCAACTVKANRPAGDSSVKKTKVCPHCKRELPRSAFSTNSSRKDGLATYCRECERERYRIAKEKKRGSDAIGIASIAEPVNPSQEKRPSVKKCVKCGRELPLEAFPVRPELRSGYDSRCRECFNAACRASKEAKRKAEEYKAEKAVRRFTVHPSPPKVDALLLPNLASCPFCGKSPSLRRLVVGSITSWEIECACTADPSRYITFSFETPDEAGKFWNHRPVGETA